ncbi:VWA domain-containing protein [Corynebacterium sp. ACRQJ]|uniref:vWA domain-containing protein n=1 Tax=Corynebacterium sp. ACRQJ TaxID=2918189 RepID=UPI001EF4E9A4|nr:VWA domain-containing protein [Corynebacterium sp. ACRQJ]MCG7268129.1 VWA domain-containing protein [Corynebacterium sp. ACRQJ]
MALLAFLTVLALVPTLAVDAQAKDKDSVGQHGGSGQRRGDGTDSQVAIIVDASRHMTEKSSGSGSETRMDVAKKAANETAKAVADRSETMVLGYGSEVAKAPENENSGCLDITSLSPLGDNKASDLEGDINKLQPKGYAPITNALKQAQREMDFSKKRSIVLISSGIDTCPHPPACEHAETSYNDPMETIHTIGVDADDKGKKVLECIAKASGGTYSDADNIQDLLVELIDVKGRVPNYGAPSGTPVQLADNPDNGFYLGEGLYQSSLPSPPKGKEKGDEKWFSISVPDNTQGRIAITPIPLGFEGSNWIKYGTEAEVRNDSCEYRETYEDYYIWPALPSAENITITPEQSCDSTKYRIKISGIGDLHDTELPVEILVGFEPIASESEAGPKHGRGVPEDGDKIEIPDTSPQPTPGGTSYATAPEITKSTVSDTLVPGEMKFYRMNVDWGQRPVAEVEFDKNEEPGSRTRRGNLYIASPRRAVTSDPLSENLKENAPVTVQAVNTPYVYYLNREGTLRDWNAADAGQWYFVVSLEGSKDNGKPNKEVEFRLSAAVEGERADGPAWRQPLEPGPAPSPEPPSSTGADGSAPQAKDIDNAPQSQTIMYAGLGLLAIVLIAGGAVYFTTVRRK